MKTAEYRLAWILVCLAGGLILTLCWLPPTPWLHPELRPATLLLSLLWLCWRLWHLDRLRTHRRRWTTSTTTTLTAAHIPTLADPSAIYLGQGFHWTATQTEVLETALVVDGSLPVATDHCGGHPALHAVGSHGATLGIPSRELTGHVGLTGTTGSGKTKLLTLATRGILRQPGTVVVIDPKSDRELLAQSALGARDEGKPFYLITPAFHDRSQHINVLATATTPAEVSTRIRALMPSAGGRGADPFFEEYALSLIELIASAQQALGQAWTLEGFYKPAMFRHHQAQLLGTYLRYLGCQGTTVDDMKGWYKKHRADDLTADGLVDDYEKPRDHFVKVTSNLRPAFRGVIGDPLGPLFSAEDDAITWKKMVEEEAVLYVSLGSMLLGEIGNRIARIILQDLVGYLGRRYAYERSDKFSAITVIIDESHQVLYPLFPDVLAQARGANSRFMLAMQSLADPEAALGKPLATRILDNLNTKIWLRLGSNTTRKDASEDFGTCTVNLPTPPKPGLSYAGVGGLSGHIQGGLRTVPTPLVRPEWLAALPRGQAFCRIQGELWYLSVPLLAPVPAATIEDLGLADMWQGLTPAEDTDPTNARTPPPPAAWVERYPQVAALTQQDDDALDYDAELGEH